MTLTFLILIQLIRLGLLGMVGVPTQLQMHPKSWRCAKILRQPERRAGGETTPPADQLIHPLVGHVDPLGQVTLRQSHGLQEFLYQQFSRVRRLSMGRYSDHGIRRLPIRHNQ
jgi:hypothetical protein